MSNGYDKVKRKEIPCIMPDTLVTEITGTG